MADQDKAPTPAERLAMGTVELAAGMLDNSTENYILIFTGRDGAFGSITGNKTWAIGAVERMRTIMREHVKREASPDA